MNAADVPWFGQLPAPSPATVLTEPWLAEVLGATGDVVRVNGRGLLSAVPDTISIRPGSVQSGSARPGSVQSGSARSGSARSGSVQGGVALLITAWAGPWPVDERWWDPAAHRRLVRFQLTTERGTAFLAVVEHQQWWITAIY